MIIQIVGTNGAGKSTVVRAIAARGRIAGQYVDCVDLRLPGVGDLVRIVGPYPEGVATGGCDALKSLDKVYELVRRGVAEGHSVLFEGAGHTMNQTRGPALLYELGVPFAVVLLTTTLGTCLDGIAARRAERGVGPLEDDYNVRNNYGRAQNYAVRMRDAGARVVRTSRGEAPDRILELLRTT